MLQAYSQALPHVPNFKFYKGRRSEIQIAHAKVIVLHKTLEALDGSSASASLYEAAFTRIGLLQRPEGPGDPSQTERDWVLRMVLSNIVSQGAGVEVSDSLARVIAEPVWSDRSREYAVRGMLRIHSNATGPDADRILENAVQSIWDQRNSSFVDESLEHFIRVRDPRVAILFMDSLERIPDLREVHNPQKYYARVYFFEEYFGNPSGIAHRYSGTEEAREAQELRAELRREAARTGDYSELQAFETEQDRLRLERTVEQLDRCRQWAAEQRAGYLSRI